MFINWSILISILYKLHYVNCDGDKKIHKNPNSIKFFYKSQERIKIFSQNDFFLKETCFQCQETEFMKLKWKEGNSHNIPTGRSTLSLLYCGITRPQRILLKGKNISDLDNDPCNISLLGKVTSISRKPQLNVTRQLNEFMRWLRNKYLEKSEQCWDKSTKTLG